MDVLTDVLATTHLQGAVFCRSELSAPWGLQFSAAPQAGFHIVARGTCWLRLDGEAEPHRLVQGDIALLPHGTGHALTDGPTTRPVPFDEVVRRGERSCERQVRYGGGGEGTVLLCGAYQFDRGGLDPLLGLLPRLVLVNGQDCSTIGALDGALRLLLGEYSRGGPGSPAVVARLVDVLFIYIVRCWLEQHAGEPQGWLGALSDGKLGRVLAELHAHPEREWTVDELGRVAGMSRAAFARRFREQVGEPPLAYLARWRMSLAARWLGDSELGLAEVATRVGYRSEFAFNRAFSRLRGVPPGRFREQARQARLAATRQDLASLGPVLGEPDERPVGLLGP